MPRSLGLLVANTTILLVALGALPTAGPVARYSEWSEPVWLGPVINSTGNDFGAAESKDGLTLYFTSTRAIGFGGEDIWVSHRPSNDAPWEEPANLGPFINTDELDRVPALSRDGHWLFFARGSAAVNFDIWVSYRLHTHEDFGPYGWQPPVRLGQPNGNFQDLAPAFFQNEAGTAFLFFASNRPTGVGDYDLYVSEQQPDGSFGPPSNIVNANSVFQDARPTISHNGLELIFHSNRPGLGMSDLWSTTRESLSAEWSAPTNLTSVNTIYNDVQPALSADDLSLYVSSNRPGGLGGTDLWVSTRTRAGRR